MKFKCWDVQNSTRDDAVEVDAPEAADAARDLAESIFYRGDYPEYQDIDVELPDGGVEHFEVHAVPTPYFEVTRKR